MTTYLASRWRNLVEAGSTIPLPGSGGAFGQLVYGCCMGLEYCSEAGLGGCSSADGV